MKAVTVELDESVRHPTGLANGRADMNLMADVHAALRRDSMLISSFIARKASRLGGVT